MTTALLEVLPFALASAISPLVFTISLLVASQKEKSAIKSMAFILGAAISIGIIGFVIFFVLAKLSPGTTYTSRDARIDIVVGILLLFFALRQFRKSPKNKEKKPQRNLSLAAAFGLGFGFMLVNATTIVMYIPAAHVASYYSTDIKLILLLEMILCSLIPAIAPPLILWLIPSQAVIDSIKTFVNEKGRYIIAIVFGLLGVLEIIKAIQFYH